MSQQHDVPVSITSARSGRSDDIRRRQVKYLVSMGIRTVCFLLAIVVPSPERWFLIAAAVFLPYFAVVLANASDGRRTSGPADFAVEETPKIGTPAGEERSVKQAHDRGTG